MSLNYILKNLLITPSGSRLKRKKPDSREFGLVAMLLLCFTTVTQAQTTIISPTGDGGFNNGSTFASNGWTVANQGVNTSKWVVGSAAAVSGSTTATAASVALGSTGVTLVAGNPNIYAGMQVTDNAGVLPANTYVSAISGATLTLSNATTLASASTVTFTFAYGANNGAVGSSTAVTLASATITLTVANPAIVVGQSISVTSGTGVLAANTYVTNVSNAVITLSQPTIAAAAATVNYSFGAVSANIAGNAAYVSNDNGVSNSYFGFNGNRTLYFYRDVTVSSLETAMTLSFDVKSPNASSNGWQVWAAPTSQAVVGTDTQVTSPFLLTAAWPGATLIAFNHTSQVGATHQTAFVPAKFAGTTFRLIFVWTNSSSAATLPPAAIDNISLISRAALSGDNGIVSSIGTGLWSNPAIWDGGMVPTPVDDVVIIDNTVSIDCKFSGANDLNIVATGGNSTLQWANTGGNTNLDIFTVSNDLNISGSGAKFNVYEGGVGANGKKLYVAHDVNVINGGRFDTSNIAFTSNFGFLSLNGSAVQTVTVDSSSFIGGTSLTTNSTTNTVNVIGQLEINNSSTATPNIIWNANNVRVGAKFLFTKGRIGLGTNKIVLGNYGTVTETFIPGNGFIGGTVSKWINAGYTTAVPAGVDFPFGLTNTYGTIYQILDAKGNSRWTLMYPGATPATGGEVAISYTDAATVATGLSVVDGAYTINNRYNGNWTVTTPNSDATGAGTITFAPNATTNTFRLGVYATGGYDAKDGTSHLMNATTALGGAHQDGTTTPFVFRTGLTFPQITAGPLYVGTGASSMVATTGAITSATSGAWDKATTWVGGVIPTACQTAVIATGHTVTVSGTSVAAGNVSIQSGATLVSVSGSLTVGCSGNNAAFSNYGTYTCSGGTLKVNGSVAHRVNSYFNHTGGNIIVDGNDNGNAATSVGFGGSLFKIETSNLNLTGGKITIVDPLVNASSAATTATTMGSFTTTTEGTTGTFTNNVQTAAIAGATTIAMAAINSTSFLAVNQYVSGTGIAAGAYITAVSINQITGAPTITLSQATTDAIPAATALSFSSMSNGCNSIVLAINPANAGLAKGEGVSGAGIPIGTTVTNLATSSFAGAGASLIFVTLSNNVTGLGTSPIAGPQTLTINPVSPGSFASVLSAANANIQVGQIVSATGLPVGTYVTSITGTAIGFSQAIQAGAPSLLSMTFSQNNSQGSGAFVYDSPNHYAAGLNHTLQIGDGVSTQKGADVTYGFNCIFQKYNVGGMLSLGNLIVNAPDGANRFMNVLTGSGQNGASNMNVQGDLTIAAGSVFEKQGANSTVYLGGNLVNNGSFLTSWQGTNLYCGNLINGVVVPTALPQSISGSGVFASNLFALSSGPTTTSIPTLQVNNTSSAGLTLNTPFSPYSVILTNGIVHTSATNLLTVGNPDMTATSTGLITGAGNSTCFIDGPVVQTLVTSNTVTQFKSLPLGKGTVYMPMTIATAGAAKFKAEAFATNSGTANAANASNLSTNRWKVSVVADGGYTSYNVKLGTTGITASSVLVQASADQGTYDVTASATTYDGANALAPFVGSPSVPLVTLATPQANTTFTGNFAFAQPASCSGTPTPGNTIASASSVCNGQATTLSLQNATTGANVTYQWKSSTTGGAPYTTIAGATNATYVATPSVATTYVCSVTCSAATGTSASVTVTMSNTATVTTTGATVCPNVPATLSASGAGTLTWYSAATGGSVLATGASYAPTVGATTTYYVASATPSSASAGQATPGVSTTTATANFKGLSFDATRRFKLTAVTVYPKNTAAALTPITIRLYDATGNQVAGTSDVTFTPTLNIGTVNSVAQPVTLNYDVPVGTGYRLVAAYGMAAANALGTSTTTQTYPAPFGSLIITGNVSDLSTATATTANAYNCFFNIQIDETCESARVPVTATVLGIGTQPTNPTICKLAGATTTATIVASGALHWSVRTGTKAPYTWTPLTNDSNYSGTTTGTLTITRTLAAFPKAGTVYRCDSSGLDCNGVAIVSNEITLQDQSVLAKAPAVKVVSVLKPTLTVCNGGTVSFSAAAGSVGVVTWEMSTDNVNWNTVKTEIPGSPNPLYTYTSGALSTGDVYFRTNASNGSCTSAVSASVHITVSAASVAGTISLNNSGTVCSYQKATTTVGLVQNSTTLTLSGSTGVVSWLSSTDGVKWAALKTSVPGTTGLANPNYTVSSTALVVNNLVKNLMFKAVVTNGACSDESATTQLTVTPIAKAGALTAPKSVCLAGDLTIASAPYVGSSIAWEVSTTSATEGFAIIPDQSSAMLSLTNIPYAAGTKFYIRSLVLSDGCFAVNSAVKTIAVDALSVGGTVTGGKLICSGANTNKLTLSGSVGKSIQWQSSSDGLTGWSDIGGATLTTYTPATVAATTYYRAVVTNGDCSVANSTSTVLTVATAAVAGTISSTENNLCPATGTTLNLTGYSGSIQWQKTASPATVSSVWANVTGVLPAVSTGNLSASTVFRAIVYVGTSSSSNCFTQTTPEYTVTVKSLPVAKAITANSTSPTGASPATALCITDSSKVLTEGVGYVGAIQWQMSTVSATSGWTDISGEIGASYTVNAPASGANYYRVKVTNGCTDKFSAAFTLYYSASACSVPLVGKSETISNVTFGVKAYPNPYAETFKLDVTTSSEESIRVNVYDMLGKQLESREYKANEISTEEIGVNYPSGVYNIIVSQGAEVKTVRVVKR